MNPVEIDEWIKTHAKPLAKKVDALDLKEWQKEAILEKLLRPYYYWYREELGKRGIPERGYVPRFLEAHLKAKEELPPREVGLIKERICASCGKEIEPSEKFTTIDGKTLHWECFEKEYV